MPSVLHSALKTVLAIAVIGTLLVTIHLLSTSPLPLWRALSNTDGSQNATVKADHHAAPLCGSRDGQEDIVVVMRTGATEIRDKLPVHFNTTFRCYPDTIIFSDYAEVFEGHQVHDALASVSDEVKQSNADFQHYLRLQQLGRQGLHDDELHRESYESGPVGKNDNPGWRLDKWKFLPMMAETLHLRPQKKWYIFVEPDTYIVWRNMAQWLQTLDPSKPSYYGSEVQIGDDVFAHGGSAFVMSRPAMEKGVELYTANLDEWHARTAQHWAGDCILGTALKNAGVDLTWSWPMFQGGNPGDMDWLEKKGDLQLWCAPALSYHHFDSVQIEAVWGFEQQRISGPHASNGQSLPKPDTILHHSDMFRMYVLPNLTNERQDWSNASPDLIPDSRELTMDGCRALCKAKAECMQYAYDSNGCFISEQVHLGSLTEGVQSGWIKDRVDAWLKNLEDSLDCTGRSTWAVT